ncbi:MAG: glycerate kinase [Acutalibacteraceae bacterium]
MKIISAVGSFKGSIESIEINNIIKAFLEKEGHLVYSVPVADGGDGLLETLTYSMGGNVITLDTVNALGKPIKAKVSLCKNIGIVEMALASGLALIEKDELNPLKASTYGTGLLIKELAKRGITEIILGIGGSATNDGGFGCLCALGFDFFDKNNNKLTPCGENLQYIEAVSDKNVPDYVKRMKIQIACDVVNPLLGENGATYIYGRQKGADDNMLAVLEKGMENFAEKVKVFCKKDFTLAAGAGAAGGLGFGLMSLLDAKPQKGAQLVLEKADFTEKLRDADLVITGEGRLDNQTAFGKLPQIVALNSKEYGVKCIGLCGSCTADASTVKAIGFEKVYELINYASFYDCMKNTKQVIEKALCSVAEDIKGM